MPQLKSEAGFVLLEEVKNNGVGMKLWFRNCLPHIMPRLSLYAKSDHFRRLDFSLIINITITFHFFFLSIIFYHDYF